MSKSIWMDETTPEEFRAEYPHLLCGSEQVHEGHGWRGTRREFGGAAEVTRTYWCEGIAATTPAACPSVETPESPQISGSRKSSPQEAE